MTNHLRVITHSGHFQPDDVFAIAALQLLLGDFELIRTRDEEVIKTGDWVVDVGRVYDPEQKRFDHHQEGGAGKRENSVPYSSIGLVWKHFGKEIAGSEVVAKRIDEKLVQPLDAGDNGINFFEARDPHPYLVDDALSSFNPSWKEGDQFDEQFVKAVEVAKLILLREIRRISDAIEAKKFIENAYNHAADKRILILDQPYPTDDFLDIHKEILFVVKPEARHTGWLAYAVRENPHSFKNRRSFPTAWAGKINAELAKVSGVPDATFCHNNLFVAIARSKEGAIALAKLAVEA